MQYVISTLHQALNCAVAATGSSELLLQFVDFICGDGKDGNCAAIAADTDRLCHACVSFSQLPDETLSLEGEQILPHLFLCMDGGIQPLRRCMLAAGRLAVARFVERCMERLFCDAWRYAPIAERKQWTFKRAASSSCGCPECIKRLVAVTDSAEQQQTVRHMASHICSMSRPRCTKL